MNTFFPVQASKSPPNRNDSIDCLQRKQFGLQEYSVRKLSMDPFSDRLCADVSWDLHSRRNEPAPNVSRNKLLVGPVRVRFIFLWELALEKRLVSSTALRSISRFFLLGTRLASELLRSLGLARFALLLFTLRISFCRCARWQRCDDSTNLRRWHCWSSRMPISSQRLYLLAILWSMRTPRPRFFSSVSSHPTDEAWLDTSSELCWPRK